jgi:ankyrin repeat protein
MFGTRSGYTALMMAAAAGHERIVQELLAEGADVNVERANGKTAMFYAVAIGRSERIVASLKSAGAAQDPVRIALTLRLIRAACADWDESVAKHRPYYPGVPRDLARNESIEDVLKAGADINDADPDGYTPLMYAANLGLVDTVKELLERGAKAGIRSRRGETAQSLAEKYGLEQVVRVLQATRK